MAEGRGATAVADPAIGRSIEPSEAAGGDAPRRLKVAINRALIDKNEAGPDELYRSGWTNENLTLDDLARAIKAGAAFCAQMKNGHRKAANFTATDVVFVDIDNGLTLDEALDHPLVRDHAAFLYTTRNHTADAHRFRVVFQLPATIRDAAEMRALLRSLALRIGGDLAATDPARISFGNRAAVFHHIGNTLSEAIVGQLIAQSRSVSTGVNGRIGTGLTTRSSLRLDVRDFVKTATGGFARFGEPLPKTRVFCPYHQDDNPSAFVVASGRGVHGLHCSACATTFWPEDTPPEVAKDFEQAARDNYNGTERLRCFDDVGIVFERGQAAPTWLKHRLTLVRSPKGSGKTTALHRYFSTTDKVLLIGHRRLLNRNMSRRLGLNCYLDRPDFSKPSRKKRANREDRFAISVDSLEQIAASSEYDVIILDEVEQVARHFLSDTLGSSRTRIFALFASLLRRAKRVVALDADLGWVSLYLLKQVIFGPALWEREDAEPLGQFLSGRGETTLESFLTDPAPDGSKKILLHINDQPPGNGEKIRLFGSDAHLVAELFDRAAAGEKCFVVANSKSHVNKLAAAFREKHPNLRVLLATADTADSEEVQAFVGDPAAKASEYDVVLSSPTMGTGIDITMPWGGAYFHVYGFAFGDITTHLDFDQQLGRVRRPLSTNVWVCPRPYFYETNTDVVRRDILGTGLVGERILGYDHNMPVYQVGDVFLELATLIRSEERASINKLRANFVAHKESQGYEIVPVPKKQRRADSGRELMMIGKSREQADRAAELIAAKALQYDDFERLDNARKNGEKLKAGTSQSLARTRIERFYRQRISAELIADDKGGRRREEILLFEKLKRQFEPDFTRIAFVFQEKDVAIRDEDRKVQALASVLQSTPIFSEGNFLAGVEICLEDLDNFVSLVADHKAATENLFGIPVNVDFRYKPIQLLNKILAMVGLRVTKCRTSKKAGALQHLLPEPRKQKRCPYSRAGRGSRRQPDGLP